MSIVNCLWHSFFHCHLICLVKQTTVRLSIIIFTILLLKDKPSVTYPLNAAQLLPLHSTWLPCGTHFSEGPQTYKQFSMSNLQDFQWHPVLVLPSSSQYPRHKGVRLGFSHDFTLVDIIRLLGAPNRQCHAMPSVHHIHRECIASVALAGDAI